MFSAETNNNFVFEFQKVKQGRVYGRRYSMPNVNLASRTVYSYTTRSINRVCLVEKCNHKTSKTSLYINSYPVHFRSLDIFTWGRTFHFCIHLENIQRMISCHKIALYNC